ncbi:flagellar assembly protein FliW [Lachnobacterium bovis]|jgi:flagellar assembly factor FliW|uniref:Flagellar assembly factor FliW n=1 Tax=Lachnobacterium bovis TaxID=140626 RepID=A0A1H9SE36_9FIRM|nr:flagellar assembly protein FliW [Lachnobacterium bovis]SER83237.1 flagellar assembly factor FliW [Lachnobacterium bovis]
MKAETRVFGTVDIADEKIITMETGMIGLPLFKKFALIFDEEKAKEEEKEATSIMWLQSLDDPETAFPVMVPQTVIPDYNPKVNDEILAPLGELTAENTYILVTVTVPSEIEDLSINLKAPIIINADTHKGVQIIVEDDFPVKFKIYDLVKGNKKREDIEDGKAGE